MEEEIIKTLEVLAACVDIEIINKNNNKKIKAADAIRTILYWYDREKNKNKDLLQKLEEHICIEVHEQIKQQYILKSELKNILDRLHISDIEPWSIYKVDGKILFDLEDLLEKKEG